MTIYKESRYYSSSVELVADPVRGTHLSVNKDLPGTRSFVFSYYQLADGDTIDIIADTMYGDGTLWWMIADANPEIINWDDLPIGTTIRVPNVR